METAALWSLHDQHPGQLLQAALTHIYYSVIVIIHQTKPDTFNHLEISEEKYLQKIMKKDKCDLLTYTYQEGSEGHALVHFTPGLCLSY